MFKSATMSLTLWYVFLAMSLSVLFSGVLYHFSTGELAEALHNQYQVLNDKDIDDRRYISTYELDARSHHLLDDLVYFNILVLVGSSLASYVLARRTLLPIEIAHQAQVRFTADASHELRTPLTAIQADTEATLMRDPNNVDLLRRTLKANLEDIKKLDKLTDHLVDLSRYDSKLALDKEDVDLETIIQEVIRQFNRRIKSNNIKVETETHSVLFRGNPHSLRQLVTIILDNAIKYTKPKGKIKLTMVKKSKHIVIIIKDNGVGISPVDLPRIFERFYRSQKTSVNKNKTTGYGLGLPLAKDIIELHRGTVDVQSKEHSGTTVTITLPLS